MVTHRSPLGRAALVVALLALAALGGCNTDDSTPTSATYATLNGADASAAAVLSALQNVPGAAAPQLPSLSSLTSQAAVPAAVPLSVAPVTRSRPLAGLPLTGQGPADCDPSGTLTFTAGTVDIQEMPDSSGYGTYHAVLSGATATLAHCAGRSYDVSGTISLDMDISITHTAGVDPTPTVESWSLTRNESITAAAPGLTITDPDGYSYTTAFSWQRQGTFAFTFDTATKTLQFTEFALDISVTADGQTCTGTQTTLSISRSGWVCQ